MAAAGGGSVWQVVYQVSPGPRQREPMRHLTDRWQQDRGLSRRTVTAVSLSPPCSNGRHSISEYQLLLPF
jgi:hypothetical protein